MKAEEEIFSSRNRHSIWDKPGKNKKANMNMIGGNGFYTT